MSDSISSSSRTIIVVGEGQTEEAFVWRILFPAFDAIGLEVRPQLIYTSQSNRGGSLSYKRVKKHLVNELRSGKHLAVTTFFDLYALDVDFPEMPTAKATTAKAGQPLKSRLPAIEKAFQDDIVASAACRPNEFIAHIQPYEFEALLFSETSAIAADEASWAGAASQLADVRASVASPEDINSGPNTHPSKRLETHLQNPKYRKTLHGPRIAEKIGLSTMEADCPHFREWLASLRKLAQVAQDAES